MARRKNLFIFPWIHVLWFLSITLSSDVFGLSQDITTIKSRGYQTVLNRDGNLDLSVQNQNDISSTIGYQSGDINSNAGRKMGMQVVKPNFTRVETPFIIALWIFSASLAKIGFHMAPKLSSIFPESCLLVVVGIVIGLVLFHTNNVGFSTITPTIFFFCMLPPIILDAGYFMPNRLFFDHLGTILLFAVVGTVWNTFAIGLSLWSCGLTGIYGFELQLLETMLFSALISAVDPVAVLAVFEEIHVNEVLYIIVFGESLLNDAVTVVLYNMFDSYVQIGQENIQFTDILAGFASFAVVAIGGTTIGIVWGFCTGFVTRFTNHVRVIEPIFVFVMSYLAYVNAEAFQMSGILAITFCGITMKNYVEENISSKSHTTVKYAMKMLSSGSETIMFILLGVNTIHDDHQWNTAFILLTLVFCSISRVIGVILLTDLANYFRLQKLDWIDKFVMSYGGLRGAIAFALVLLVNPERTQHQPLFATATICVIYFTVFFQGFTIKPLVKFLKVKRAEKKEKTMNGRIHEKVMDYIMAGMESISGHMGNFQFRDKFKQINNRYIRPCIIREHRAHEPKILETYSKLTMKDAVEFIQRNGSSFQTERSSSLAVLLRNCTANHLPNSVAAMDNTWNLDIGELVYSPSAKDLTDAEIHHVLSDEFWKNKRRNYRKFRYSRHAVHDHDLQDRHLNRYMQIHIRRMLGEIRHHERTRSPINENRNNDRISSNRKSVSFKVIQDGESSSSKCHEMDRELSREYQGRNESLNDLEEGITFTAMGQSEEQLIAEENYCTTPTALEMELPWKRDRDHDGRTFALKQNEFPLWIENEDYENYHSPTISLLNDLENVHIPVRNITTIHNLNDNSSKDETTHPLSPTVQQEPTNE